MRSLRLRLAQSQLSQIVNRRRVIIILEGWVGSGKKTALRRMVGSWDPCNVDTVCVGRTANHDSDRHWLAPYWANLPGAGNTAIFYPSWYRRIAEMRLDGKLDDKQFARACDEINEFEAQQRDHGTLIVKLFFHMTADRQAAVMRERQSDPWMHHLLSPGAAEAMSRRDDLIAIIDDIFAQTDTRWAPWTVVNGNDEAGASIQSLDVLAAALEKAMPTSPPADGETVIPFRHSRAG